MQAYPVRAKSNMKLDAVFVQELLMQFPQVRGVLFDHAVRDLVLFTEYLIAFDRIEHMVPFLAAV
jgi:hypothetical protein